MPWDKPAFTVLRWGTDLGKCVRTERWRYSEWNGGKDGMELYDHRNDPFEFTNLAHDPNSAEILAGLKEMIHQESEGLTTPRLAATAQKPKKRK